MQRLQTKLFASFTTIALSFAATQVQADAYEHLDELALKIQGKATQLLHETRHYRHTPNYVHLVNDAAKMRRLAAHIHRVAHVRGSLRHLESDLRQLDAAFHHIEEVFDATEIDASHGHGHVHGNTRHGKCLLNDIEDCIHHMQEDVAELRNLYRRPRPYYRPYVNEIYGGCSQTPVYRGGVYGGYYGGHYGGHYGGKGGIKIGGKNFGINIRF